MRPLEIQNRQFKDLPIFLEMSLSIIEGDLPSPRSFEPPVRSFGKSTDETKQLSKQLSKPLSKQTPKQRSKESVKQTTNTKSKKSSPVPSSKVDDDFELDL